MRFWIELSESVFFRGIFIISIWRIRGRHNRTKKGRGRRTSRPGKEKGVAGYSHKKRSETSREGSMFATVRR